MPEYYADLHFHSPYAGGVSKNMTVPVISEQAKLKGLQIVSSADITHSKWLKHVKQHLVEESNGIYREQEFGTYFIIGTEVQDNNRVHHLLFFPSIENAELFRKSLEGKAIFDSWGCGRPRIKENGEKITEKVIEANGIIGPAHAFTPYFSVYGHFNSVNECYGANADKIHFMELGLSADTGLADLISANHKYNFLTCSDSHSPWPHRIGREFVKLKMKKPDFPSLKKALESREKDSIMLNVGLDPREGKYHITACNSCFAQYEMKQAAQFNWRCMNCKGQIKKGVKDRIMELADTQNGKSPDFRAPYKHLLPLAEIIQNSYKIKNVQSQKVQTAWFDLVNAFGNEIKVLLETEVNELAGINKEVAEKIDAFRNGWVFFKPGGGGNYGIPIVCSSEKELKEREEELKKEKSELSNQKSLAQFG